MSAQEAVAALRSLHPGKDDEAIKRALLRANGWLFSRRTGIWERFGYEIDPTHTLASVMTFLADLEGNQA